MNSVADKKARSAAKILYLSHGGGPLPLLGDPAHQTMVDKLREIGTRLRQQGVAPKRIVLVSAHWEEAIPHITASEKPELIYDYFGFPPESYNIQYPALGAPDLAEELGMAFEKHDIPTALAPERGFDHGMFVPLKIMFPEADIPCVQVSLSKHLSAEFHLRMGRALSELEEDTLLIGSGFSFHNMRAFFSPVTPETQGQNVAFQKWLTEVCFHTGLSAEERWQALAHWESAPHARYCHPREEHLLPLHVCYGAAQRVADEVFSFDILGQSSRMFLWS